MRVAAIEPNRLTPDGEQFFAVLNEQIKKAEENGDPEGAERLRMMRPMLKGMALSDPERFDRSLASTMKEHFPELFPDE